MTHPQSAGRAGYTLVEVLVTMGIVAALVGLGVPAVMKLRSGGSKAQCANHLRQLGLAAAHAHDARGSYPPVFYLWPAESSNSPMAGALWHLLPYMEQDGLYAGRLLDEEIAPAQRLFRCPADPTASSGSPTSSYVVNEFLFTGRKGGPVADGTANTALFTETYANCGGDHPVWWSNASAATLIAYGPGPAATFRAAPGTTAAAPGSNRGCGFLVGENAQASHGGGIQVAMADGSVRTATKATADATAPTQNGGTVTAWAAAFTPAGNETNGGAW